MADLQFIEAELGGQTFIWKDQEFPCSPSSADEGESIEIGGRLVPIDLKLIVRLETFLGEIPDFEVKEEELNDPDLQRPIAGQHLVFRGVEREIASAKLGPSRAHVVLALTDPNNAR